MAKTYSYNGYYRALTAKGGTESDPITFANLVTADRAGTLNLLSGVIDADPDVFSLNQQDAWGNPRQVQPVELRAITLDILCTARAGATCDISGKDAWGNSISENGIDISSGSATTQNRFSSVDVNGVIVHGLQNGDSFDIDQSQWGVVWDVGQDTYHLDTYLYLGDGSTPTYFIDKKKFIVFNDILDAGGSAQDLIKIYSNANLQLGELVDAARKDVCNGCTILSRYEGYNGYLLGQSYGINSYRRLYGCTIVTPNKSNRGLRIGLGGDGRLWHCNLVNYVWPNVWENSDLYRIALVGGSDVLKATGLRAQPVGGPLVIEDYVATNVRYAIRALTGAQELKVSKMRATNGVAALVFDTQNYDAILTDCEFTLWTMYMRGPSNNGDVLRKYTVNIHVADKNGVDLEGVNIVCKDKDGIEVFNVNTDAYGDIIEQEVLYQRWSHELSAGFHGEEDAITYSPHSFIISKDGYETLEIDAITLNEPVEWHLELQDPTTCDYPAMGDVEEGVAYNYGAKVGDFHVPLETEVKKSVGYGAGGTEFLGTLESGAVIAGQNLEGIMEEKVNLEGALEKRTNIEGALQKKTNMIGTLQRKTAIEGTLRKITGLEGEMK